MTRGIGLSASQTPLASAYDLALFDLDGVVYIGRDAVPGAVEAISALTAPFAFLTNNATRAPVEVADHLRGFGLEFSAESVITAGQVVALLIEEQVGAGARVLVAGADGLRQVLRDQGFEVVASMDDGPVAVAQGGVVDVRWSELAEASYAVAAGLPWFASNPDTTFPTPRGLAPGNGALVAAVQLATGREPVVAGKPATPIYEEALRRFDARRPIMVGDRPDTDIDGALAAGIEAMVVLTGICDLDEVESLPPGRRPGYIGADLGALHVPHHDVEVAEDVARCGSAVATVRDGLIEVSGAPALSVDALRARVGLAWARRDRDAHQAELDAKMKS